MKPIPNPSAPPFEPERWNDLSWMKLNFVLSQSCPDVLEGFKRIGQRMNPNNVNQTLKRYSDHQIAGGLGVPEESVQHFRDIVLTLMQARQLSTNCYCHAANDAGPFEPFLKPWPGMIHGLKPSDGKSYERKTLIENVAADGGIPIGLQPMVREGFYNALMLIRDDGRELHFVRENSNGVYSHKTGLGAVTNLDASDKQIIDPLAADWGDFTLAQVFHFPEGGLTVGVPKEDRRPVSSEIQELIRQL